MRKYFSSEPKWIWLFIVVLAGLLALGLAILPEVFRRGYALPDITRRGFPAPGTPIGLYILTLITLALFIGVLISLAIERFERLMVILFIAFRLGAVAWEYQLGRHSLWYLAGSVFAHLLVGGLVLLFLSRHPLNRDTIFPDDLDTMD